MFAAACPAPQAFPACVTGKGHPWDILAAEMILILAQEWEPLAPPGPGSARPLEGKAVEHKRLFGLGRYSTLLRAEEYRGMLSDYHT